MNYFVLIKRIPPTPAVVAITTTDILDTFVEDVLD